MPPLKPLCCLPAINGLNGLFLEFLINNTPQFKSPPNLCNEKKIPRTDKLVAIAKWLMIELSDLIENKEKKEVSEFDKLLYRLKDDEDFCNLVEKLNKFDLEKFNKVADYIDLLSK